MDQGEPSWRASAARSEIERLLRADAGYPDLVPSVARGALALLAALLAGFGCPPCGPSVGLAEPSHPMRPGPAAPRRPVAAWVDAQKRALLAVAPDIAPSVLERALVAAHTARRAGFGRRKPFLTVVDHDRPSSQRRWWTFDLKTRRLVFHEHVAHGRGTGEERAERVSNEADSHASSVGLFVTREIFRGRRGRSLRLIGLEPGFNDRAFARAIVVHGAFYMSAAYRSEHGRFGQSHGCPALDPAISWEVIRTLAGGSLVFVHLTEPTWLAESSWLKGQRPRFLRARPHLREGRTPPPGPRRTAGRVARRPLGR